MTVKKAINVLEKHNKWRRGNDKVKPQNPSEIGKAIDIAVKLLKYVSEKENINKYQF